MTASRRSITSGLILVASLATHESTLHPALGLVFASAAGAHAVQHRRWISAAAPRLGRGLAPSAARRFVVVAILVATVALVAASGIGLLLGADSLRGLHAAVVVALVPALAAHVLLHRRSFERLRKET